MVFFYLKRKTFKEHEPGWLGGELNGKIGWFPEAYAQQLGENGQPVAAEPTLQTIAEVSETSSDKGSLQDQGIIQVQSKIA